MDEIKSKILEVTNLIVETYDLEFIKKNPNVGKILIIITNILTDLTLEIYELKNKDQN